MGVPMMVDSDWLAAVDAFVRANAEGVPAPANAADSRFYDVRPIYVRSSWTWNDDDEIWKAKMNFVVRDAPALSVYDVYAPTFSSANAPTVSGRAFAVWRGRWELLDRPRPEYSGGNGINITTDNEIENTGVLNVNGVALSVVLDTRMFETSPNWSNCFCLKHSSELRGGGAIVVTDRTNNNVTPGGVAPESYQQISFAGLPVTVGGSEPTGPYKGAVAVAFYSNSGSALPAATVTASLARFDDATGELAFSTSTLYTKTIEVVTNAVYNQSTGLIGLTKETITYLSLTP